MSTLNPILAHLNQAQQEAVTTGLGPILILAGAGSGKTRVLTHRIAHLITNQRVDPDQILAVTFTNKAAHEMKERVEKLVNKGLTSLPLICTFHSFCARVLRRDGKHLGLAPAYLIYDETDQLELIKGAMKKLEISVKRLSVRALRAAISGAKNELISPEAYQKFARGYFTETVAQVYPVYQNLLRQAGAVDFDDLLVLTVKLFQDHPHVLEKYQERFRFILIDEYQDTNRAQYLLTKQLAQKYQNLFVVGDAAQSIYSFRGADHRNLTSLQNDFPQIRIYHLERNYRSTQTILSAANAVISHNTSHPILTLYTRNPVGQPVQLYQAADELEEAQFVAESILTFNPSQPSNNASIAVLYRTNAQSRTFEEAFLHLGIPYVLVGGVRFYERKEIKDILAYLRLLHNPNDHLSLTRATKIGKRRLDRFQNWSLKIRPKLSSSKSPPTTRELLDQILKNTGYLERFKPEDESDLARLENIKELGSVADVLPELSQFLENVALVQQESLPDRPMVKQQPVTLLTVHAAKGLEFNTVFMVGMEENLFPHARAMFEKHELEEERRLAYVGMTRAKEGLTFTHARRRLYLGSLGNNQLSRFVEAIPEELIKDVF